MAVEARAHRALIPLIGNLEASMASASLPPRQEPLSRLSRNLSAGPASLAGMNAVY